MAEDVVPVPVEVPRRTRSPAVDSGDGGRARALGHAAAGMLDYLIGVVDREDRLESGSGEWKDAFTDDEGAAPEAVRSSVLRLLRLAADGDNFALLEILASGEGLSTADLALKLGTGRLPVSERISDLVSAGLVVKIPEADQVRATDAGAAVVRLVGEAVAAGATDLIRRRR